MRFKALSKAAVLGAAFHIGGYVAPLYDTHKCFVFSDIYTFSSLQGKSAQTASSQKVLGF